MRFLDMVSNFDEALVHVPDCLTFPAAAFAEENPGGSGMLFTPFFAGIGLSISIAHVGGGGGRVIAVELIVIERCWRNPSRIAIVLRLRSGIRFANRGRRMLIDPFLVTESMCTILWPNVGDYAPSLGDFSHRPTA